MRTRRQVFRKLRSQRGFTLAELLMVVLILLLVSAVMAAGIPAAARAYQKVVDSANAQLLLSTTVSSLERELSLASEIETDSDGKVSYINTTGGHNQKVSGGVPVEARYMLSVGDDGIKRTWKVDDSETDLVPESLTIAGKTKGGLIPKYDGEPVYEDGFFTISKLRIEKADGTVLAGPVDLKIFSIAIQNES